MKDAYLTKGLDKYHITRTWKESWKEGQRRMKLCTSYRSNSEDGQCWKITQGGCGTRECVFILLRKE